MLDIKISGGTIVDGSGQPGFHGDVGIRDGRIVAVGAVAEDARETVDATGRIVAPGFIDVHTHYDAQVFWDPALSPSCFHGVTTVLGGFCGFSVAPTTPEASEYLAPMLARVEGMPLETLLEAVPWNWRSFGEYLDRIEGKLGLNAGFFAGHSAIRRVVMGARAVGEKATPEDVAQMQALLDTSLAEGALGFSSTIAATHNDADGNPVPSRWAEKSEFIALASVVKDHEGTGLEFLPGTQFNPEIIELITDISIAGNRAVNWNALAVMDAPNVAERVKTQLAVTDYARARGGEVLALTIPCTPDMFLNFRTGFVLDSSPGLWREIFKLPPAERIEELKKPDVRRQLAADAALQTPENTMYFASNIAQFRIVSVESDANKKYEGRNVGDIATEEGREPIDVILDLAIADNLQTIFAPWLGVDGEASYKMRGEIWKDDRTIIGASDAGAHLDMIDTFAFSTTVLEHGVRNHQVIGLEEAVRLMTDRPARYMGLIDRGRLAPGYHADVVVFDKATVGKGPTYNRYDVPGDQFRVYADAIGVDHVFVNGVQIVRDGAHTGALPGTVLRSGRDTKTTAMNALQEGSRTPDLVPAA